MNDLQFLDWLTGGKRPNQALEPTPLLVMPRADARVTPAALVAHL